MLITPSTPADDPELDALVSSVPDSLIYYTSRYRAFLQRVLPGVESSVLVAREAGRSVGFLPFSIKTDREWGGVLNSQPFFGSHGGVMVAPGVAGESVGRSLYGALSEVARSRQLAAFTVVENLLQPLSESDQQALGTEVVDYRIGQFTPLPDATGDVEAEVFSRLHLKTRNAVRKGRKAQLRIECTTDPDVLAWFQRVHEASILALGGVPKPLEVFRALFDVFGPAGQVRLYVGRKDAAPVCGLLVLLHGQTVEYYTPVVEDAHRDSQALSGLIVDVMIAAAREGYRTWNWGGTWPSQAGVYRFKSRWGAEERQYRYHGRILNPAITRAGKQEILTRFPSFYVYKFA